MNALDTLAWELSDVLQRRAPIKPTSWPAVILSRSIVSVRSDIHR
jgi:hypothetical protein